MDKPKTAGQIHFEAENLGYGLFWSEQDESEKYRHERLAAAVIAHARPQIVAEVEGEFKDAVIDALVVSHIYAKEHDTDARKAVADLLDYSVAVALDPQVSRPAAGLVAEARKAERELREEVATIRAATIEECAKVCVDRAKDWEDSVNEGSEQMAYETKVLYDAAAEIRALLTTGAT